MTPNLKNLYLICSHSCMSQMEVPFLLNNSPNLWGSCDPDENWAEYDLPQLDTSIDCEPGPFGSVRVHDDYWKDSSWQDSFGKFTIIVSRDSFGNFCG